MGKMQFYGITYPFTADNAENYFVDLNYKKSDKVKSELMHIIFTPKGQKLRDPEFGTDLIKYIFEPSDEISWNEVQNEVSESVSKYIKGIKINSISVLKNSEEISEIFVRVDYSVSDGINIINDSLITKL